MLGSSEGDISPCLGRCGRERVQGGCNCVCGRCCGGTELRGHRHSCWMQGLHRAMHQKLAGAEQHLCPPPCTPTTQCSPAPRGHGPVPGTFCPDCGKKLFTALSAALALAPPILGCSEASGLPGGPEGIPRGRIAWTGGSAV